MTLNFIWKFQQIKEDSWGSSIGSFPLLLSLKYEM